MTSVKSERFSLGIVEPHIDPETDHVLPHVQSGIVDLEAYSRFKYGEGAVAQQYGRALATEFTTAHPNILEEGVVHVTSSAYKVAPPAADSLLPHFVAAANKQASELGAHTTFVPFKINRANLTNGDYASMTIEQRKEIMQKNGLSLPEGVDLRRQTVVALDDICVTGSHEKSIHNVLEKAGADQAYYLYLLKVVNGQSHPKLEAAINGVAVKSVHDLLELAYQPTFIPNARICKFVLSQSVDDIELFRSKAPQDVYETVASYIEGDGLTNMPAYQLGYAAFKGIAVDIA